jgi:hypothetical protein
MKRNAIIFMGILLLLLAAVTAWRMRPEPVEGSELYQRYKDVPGVRVGFIKDFPINDTITCDVTTFEALTDEGWEWMLDSLGLQRTSVLDSIGHSEAWPGEISDNASSYWQSKRFHPEVRGGSKVLGDSVDCNFASLYYRWMAVFHTTTTEGRSAVIDYYFDYQVEHPMTMMPTKDKTINL